MKKIRIFVCIIVTAAIFVGGYVIKLNLYDERIADLTTIRSNKQSVADSLKERAQVIDEQSKTDKAYIESVFGQIFTFYDLDGFKRARNLAADNAMPADFINSFYDMTTLSDIYADEMLDIVCRYDSADIYLLDRDEHMSYYYADVKLSLVKYSGTIELSFFITVNNDAGADKFASIIYYENKR